ncbi:Adenosine/AMP deaminase family protein [Leishmania donovani]|uniref:AMP deaminase n=2 Tax=Leishmania donovani TaxID=5661 RepID=A0A504X6R4_LEIDO|nr:Adenosine/AMP deaminase family protein [Leishmania donovani]
MPFSITSSMMDSKSNVGDSATMPMLPEPYHGALFQPASPHSDSASTARFSEKSGQLHSCHGVPHGGLTREPSEMFQVVIDGDDGGVEMRRVHDRIEAALRVRLLYRPLETRVGSRERANPYVSAPMPGRITIVQKDGVYQVSDHDASLFLPIPTWSQYAMDVQKVRLTVGNAGCVNACHHRLGIMQERSRMFFLLNAEMEERANYHKAGGVFSAARKVDNAVLLSESMDAQELLEGVKEMYRRSPEAAVHLRDGSNSTLRELLGAHGVRSADELTVAGLGWKAEKDTPHQGQIDSADCESMAALGAELRFSFTALQGYLCEKVLRRVVSRAERPLLTPQAAEYSVPLYGLQSSELSDLAELMRRKLEGPHPRVQYILSICFTESPPFEVASSCTTLQDQLDNIFLALFKATLAPEDPSNAGVAWLLGQVGGLQMLHAQDGPGRDFDEMAPPPDQVRIGAKQSGLYYMYYLYANLAVLNSLRRRKGLEPLQLRCTGNKPTGMDDLIGAYILSDVITRATKITDYPVLQYLCGLHRVGLTVSPLCDHMEGIVAYKDHPLPHFLHRCLHITLSTESPLRYHHNPRALIEEYATAQKMFRLSSLDMTELAHNSVLMSSFSPEVKRQWLGDNYQLGVEGNEFELSHVTNARLAFRDEAWQLERNMMRDLNLNPPHEVGAGLSRWHHLSNVQEVEYDTVMDNRVRFPRTVLKGPHKDAKAATAAPRVARALDLRHQYIWRPPPPWETAQRHGVETDFQRRTATFNEDEWTYAASDAVFIAYPKSAVHAWPRSLPTLDDFHKHLRELRDICASAEVKEYAHKRLENLDHKFRLHLALNHENEAGTTEDRQSSNRDFYQATKVDTHIHMAAGMTPKQILKFVLAKLKESGDDIAMKKGDDIITLGQLFAKAGITPNLTVDQLNVQADHTLFERFDNFNSKYNPMENGDLRSLLLKTDNFMNGRYFAELIHDVFEQYSRDRYTYAENRLSVYGINVKEWDKLAHWFATHGMANKHNKWIIQVPRVYKVFRAQNVIGSFGQYLQNIFQPLWEASLHPSEHPTLHNFLNHVSGFDSVDNEATIDLPFTTVSPWAWTVVENPPYNYYLYYLYANIRTLNEFRASRGFSTFGLRPHCGESGSEVHLYGAFLCANSICHGINLRNDPPMQYLYYLAQIGLHVSPLSNNALFLHFLNNPFPDFFHRGLNVSLSTDDPMMFHQTQEPLIEEYSIAARVWGLSANDLCEIARNSVLQCGFDNNFKCNAIGDRWFLSSSLGNDSLRTHLSDIRVAFRFETYHTELQQLELCCGRPVSRFMMTAAEERAVDVQLVDVQREYVLLSTHDQAMEVMLREMEDTKAKILQTRAQVDILRRQQRSLLEKITEMGIRRQEAEEQSAQEKELPSRKGPLYVREKSQVSQVGGGDGERSCVLRSPTCPTQQGETLKRLLRWKPMPPDLMRSVTQASFSGSRGRPLPPLPVRQLYQSTTSVKGPAKY